MSSKIKFILITQVFLILILISSISISIRKTEIINLEKFGRGIDLNKKLPKLSTYQEISPLIINGNDEWQQLASSVPWCNGSGAFNDPYIIDNIYINGQNQDNCIIIKNTNAYFIIQNSIFNFSRDHYESAGIYLENVKNSKVLKNVLPFHFTGIKLMSSNNNTIKDNLLEFCHSGIYLRASSDNTISNNQANFNEFRGISILHGSNFNSIYENTINRSDFDGITVLDTNNNNICNNTILNFKHHGIWTDGHTFIKNNVIEDGHTGILVWGYSNIIEGNKFINCGIAFSKRTYSLGELSSHVISTSNTVNGNPVYYYANELGLNHYNFTNAGQVLLVNCYDTTISNLVISNTTDGIFSYLSKNLAISSCRMENTNEHAIYLESCQDNLIVDNIIKNCFRSIKLKTCISSNIKNNVLSSNSYGLYLGYGINYLIQGNTATNNYFYGLYLGSGEHHIILNNNFSNNGEGLHIFDNALLTLKSNIVNNNKYNGIDLSDSSNSIISNNYVINNGRNGIDLTMGNNNEFYGNFVNLNRGNGFDLGGVHNCYFLSNIVNNNENFGFYLSNCDQNTMVNNIINNNYCGMNFTVNSDNNIIIMNNLKNNTVCYYEEDTCLGNVFQSNNCQGFNPNFLIIGSTSILVIFILSTTIYLILNKKRR